MKLTVVVSLFFIVFFGTYNSIYTQNKLVISTDIVDDSQKKEPEVVSDLVIQDRSITEITAPASIRRIRNDLSLQYNPALETITELSNIVEVEGDLRIIGNPNLESLSGLNGINKVGGDIIIKGNGKLVNLDGLDDIHIGGSIVIESNNSLTSLNGLNVGDSIRGHLRIQTNEKLKDISVLNTLQSIEGDLLLSNNPSLESMPLLPDLNKVSGDFRVVFHENLQKIHSLFRLEYVGGSYVIEGNPALEEIGEMPVLKNIGGQVLFRDLNRVEALAGMPKLSTIKKGLRFIRLPKIKNLSKIGNDLHVGVLLEVVGCKELSAILELSDVTVLEGSLTVKNNDNLESLIGLENLSPSHITNLTLYNNSRLSLCHIKSVCDFLASDGRSIVESNDFNCSSNGEIEMQCAKDYNAITSSLVISPNPVSEELVFSFKEHEIQSLRVINSNGMVVLKGRNALNNTLDIAHLLPGVYLLEIIGKGSIAHKKRFIKH